MEKLNFFYAFLIGILIFSSCSSSDDNETALSIIGGWTVSESKLNGDDVTNQSFIRLLTADNRTEFRFLIEVGGDFELRIAKGNWSKNGNILTIDFDNAYFGTKIYTVTELTNSTMKWESEISEVGTLKETLIR